MRNYQFVKKNKIFQQNSIFIFDKSYGIDINSEYKFDFDSKAPFEYNDKIVKSIEVKKIKESKFSEIRDYIYEDNNAFLNWIIGDNGCWKTTLLNQIDKLKKWTFSKYIYSEDINFLINKKSWIIYIFQVLNNESVKNWAKKEIEVNFLNLKCKENINSIIMTNNIILSRIIKNILKLNKFDYALNIKTHNNDSKKTNTDTFEYLYIYIQKYIYEKKL